MDELLYQIRDVFNPQILDSMDNATLFSWMSTCRLGRDMVQDYLARFEGKIYPYTEARESLRDNGTIKIIDSSSSYWGQLHGERKIQQTCIWNYVCSTGQPSPICTQTADLILHYFRGELWGHFKINICGTLPKCMGKFYEKTRAELPNPINNNSMSITGIRYGNQLRGPCNWQIHLGRTQVHEDSHLTYKCGQVQHIHERFNMPKDYVQSQKIGNMVTKTGYHKGSTIARAKYVNEIPDGSCYKNYRDGKIFYQRQIIGPISPPRQSW
jgi:hypothetical protein